MSNTILGRLVSLIPPISVKVVSLCFLWYSVSAVSSQITKAILNEFPFPLALGEFQFIIVFGLSLTTISIISKFPEIHSLFPNGSVPPTNLPLSLTPNPLIISTVFPLACFQFLGKLFSHTATSLVPVSTVAGIKTLSPLILVTAYKFIYKVQFPLSTYLSLIPLVSGISLIVLADTKATIVSTTSTHAEYIGILYAALSLVVFVAQNIYGKTVFTYNQHTNNHAELALAQSKNPAPELPISTKDIDDHTAEAKIYETYRNAIHYEQGIQRSQIGNSNLFVPKIRSKYDKLTLLLYISALGAVISLPWFLYIEAHHFIPLLRVSPTDATEAQVVFIPWNKLLLNGVSHYLQSLIAFHLLGAIPTLSYSIASMMKKIMIIVVSMIYTGHSINIVQGMGLMLTTAGLYSYDRWGARKHSN